VTLADAIGDIAERRRVAVNTAGGHFDTIDLPSSAWSALCKLSTSNAPADDVVHRLRRAGISIVRVDGEQIYPPPPRVPRPCEPDLDLLEPVDRGGIPVAAFVVLLAAIASALVLFAR
jgi:hypothetical protein